MRILSHVWESPVDLLGAEYAGNGYATEAFSTMVVQLFERIAPSSEGGYDHLEGWTDIENWPSRRILEKCGFTFCEYRPDPDNAVRGPSEIAVFRKARPGKTLEGLGLLPSKASDDPAPSPPLQ